MIQLTASVNMPGADQSVTWASSNTSVATVSSSGLVTGLKTGTVRTAAAADGNVYMFLLMVTA